MILFFEGKEYKRTLLENVFGRSHAKVISRGNFKDDKAILDCVGYYYESEHQHIFILPKVFFCNGKGFGFIELSDSSPITVTSELVARMKEEGWVEKILIDLPIYLYQAIEKYRKRIINTIAIIFPTFPEPLRMRQEKNGSTEPSGKYGNTIF